MDIITIIRNCGTKYRKVAYMREQAEGQGMKATVINVVTSLNPSRGHDVSKEDIAKATGTEWAELEPRTRGEKITFMMEAMASYAEGLYTEGKADGILSAGGLQSTVMATSTMKRLPMGFPEVIATTVASGHKTFESVVGAKDIVTIPSVCNFIGLNIVTRQIMANTCAYCTGIVKHVGQVLKKDNRPVVGVTLMGIMNTGACAAISGLKWLDIELIGFHSTDADGAIMEQMVTDGLTDGILGLTAHEITQEYFKGGFSYGEGAEYRPTRGVEEKVPLVVSVGGLDFADSQVGEFPPHMDERIYMTRNTDTVHIELLPDEAEITTARFATQIEKIDYPVKLLIPTDGMRHNTREGEALYYKEVDDIIIHQLKEIRNPNVEIITIPRNLDIEEWGIQVAHHMVDELKERAVIGDEIQY